MGWNGWIGKNQEGWEVVEGNGRVNLMRWGGGREVKEMGIWLSVDMSFEETDDAI